MRMIVRLRSGSGAALLLCGLLSCGGGGGDGRAPGAAQGSAPAIALQPQDAAVLLGQPATFTGSATGDPAPSLLWYRGESPLAGEASPTLVLPAAARADDGSLWTLKATSPLGVAPSRAARLTVQWPPAFTVQPASMGILEGQDAAFQVQVDANPAPSLQWYRDGIPIPLATGATCTVQGAALQDGGARFTCRADNGVGSAVSEAALLTVARRPTLPVFTLQPTDQTVNEGQTATFTAAGTGYPTPGCQWRRNGADLAGATSTTCRTPVTTRADDGTTYQPVLGNSAGSVPGSLATLHVQWLAIAAQPVSRTVDAGATVTFTVVADAKPAPTCLWRKDGVALAATGATLTLGNVTAADAGTYRATLANAAGTLESSAVTLGVVTPPVHVKIIGFNDFHGYIDAPAGTAADPANPGVYQASGGAAHLATWVAALKARNPNHVVVSAGDNLGASPLASALFHDEPTVACLGLLGLEFSAVGNHELDEGRDELLRIQNGGCHPVDGCVFNAPYPGASFQYLAANITDRTTGRTILPPYAIKTFQGVPVAFVGAILQAAPSSITPAGITTLAFGDEAAAVNALVPTLKAQGVQVLVLLLHEGGTAVRTRLDPAVAVVVAGHDHLLTNSYAGGNLLVEAGSCGLYVSEIDLALDPVTHKLVGAPAATLHAVFDSGIPDAAVKAVVARADALAGPLVNRVAGTATATLDQSTTAAGESVMGDLVADAHLESMADAQLAFTNGGGIRADLVPGPGGTITYGQLFASQPFGNVLVTMTLTGAEVAALLEAQWNSSGTAMLLGSRTLTYSYDSTLAYGSRLVPGTVRVGGVLLDPAADYRVTMNDYLAAGIGRFHLFAGGRNRVVGVLDVEAMESYFNRHSPVAPTPRNRVTKVR
jgi:5'-nucleotidase